MRTPTDAQSTSRRSSRPAIRIAAFASAIALVFAACGGDSKNNGIAGVSGDVYNLTTYAGHPVPWDTTETFTEGTTSIAYSFGLKSGAIGLQSNGHFDAVLNIHDKVVSNNPSIQQSYDSTTTQHSAGTYTISGSTIAFTSPDTASNGVITQMTSSGTIANSTITLADTTNGVITTIVFKK